MPILPSIWGAGFAALGNKLQNQNGGEGEFDNRTGRERHIIGLVSVVVCMLHLFACCDPFVKTRLLYLDLQNY